MSSDQIIAISQALGLIVFYAITGLGPGLAIGIMIGNQLVARDKETLMRKQETSGIKAFEHNAQWDPKHKRWQKK